jgi:hypothetical protein
LGRTKGIADKARAAIIKIVPIRLSGFLNIYLEVNG